MIIKIIKNEEEYNSAIELVEELISKERSIEEDDQLELLTFLIDKYEEEQYPIELPDPIDAIKFRMEQEGLKQKDLVPYIGSKSKVSEVLAKKRPLSINMIRQLHVGLGIPAEVLIQQKDEDIPETKHNPDEYPFNEMYKRGYFVDAPETLNKAKEYGEELLNNFFSEGFNNYSNYSYYRKSTKDCDSKAIDVWKVKILKMIAKTDIPKYKRDVLSEENIRALVNLSSLDDGPKLAVEFLKKHGIHLIVLKHFSGTHFDGAVFLSPTGNPVIGMTLRFGRIDSFWFTLLHEIGHIKYHLENDKTLIIDDLEDTSKLQTDNIEQEANEFARNALIPEDYWDKYGSELTTQHCKDTIMKVANELNISSAIIAGRIRNELDNYTILTNLIKSDIRSLFEY